MINFEDYIKDVKSQLCCNNDLSKIDFITYDFTEEQIDNNLVYFKECFSSNLSGYKALLFFMEYLEENREVTEDTTTYTPKGNKIYRFTRVSEEEKKKLRNPNSKYLI